MHSFRHLPELEMKICLIYPNDKLTNFVWDVLYNVLRRSTIVDCDVQVYFPIHSEKALYNYSV